MKICLYLLLAGSFLTVCSGLTACSEFTARGEDSKKEDAMLRLLQTRKTDYIRKVPGKDEAVSEEIIQKGEVLIGYSDCYICHRENEKARGPAFRDIAARYPRNEIYIKMLASKVINGGSGAWGYAVMSPHPDVSSRDAEAMVTYILSLETRK